MPSSADAVVSTMNFETGVLVDAVAEVEDAVVESSELTAEPALFSSDLESGDLATWSSHS
jgi:hypothetical protein